MSETKKWALIPKEAFDQLVRLSDELVEYPGTSRRAGQAIAKITSQVQILGEEELHGKTTH